MTDDERYRDILYDLIARAVIHNNIVLAETLIDDAVRHCDSDYLTFLSNMAVPSGLAAIARLFLERGCSPCHRSKCLYDIDFVHQTNLVVCELVMQSDACACGRTIDDSVCKMIQWNHLSMVWYVREQYMKTVFKKYHEHITREEELICERMRKNDRMIYHSSANYGQVDTVTLTAWFEFNRLSPHVVHCNQCMTNMNVFNICYLLRSMSGHRFARFYNTNDYRGRLSTENRTILDDSISKCGVRYMVGSVAVTSDQPLSLKNICRVAIRRCIGSNHPIGNLTDLILVLYKDDILPRKVVTFLLFRDEPIPGNL
jgi:hypothetical protein